MIWNSHQGPTIDAISSPIITHGSAGQCMDSCNPRPFALTWAKFRRSAETRGCRVWTRACVRAAHATKHPLRTSPKTSPSQHKMVPNSAHNDTKGAHSYSHHEATNHIFLLLEPQGHGRKKCGVLAQRRSHHSHCISSRGCRNTGGGGLPGSGRQLPPHPPINHWSEAWEGGFWKGRCGGVWEGRLPAGGGGHLQTVGYATQV